MHLDHGRDFLMHLNISLYYMCTHVYTQRLPGDEGRESDTRCIALRFPLTCTIDMHVSDTMHVQGRSNRYGLYGQSRTGFWPNDKLLIKFINICDYRFLISL